LLSVRSLEREEHDMRRWLWAFSILLIAGCSSKLETGYQPQVLGASAAQRRAYYAVPFTPEATAPKTDKETEMSMRRPRPGY
jgi:hypothetical protein